MTLHILSTTSPGKQPRKSFMSEPNSAADRVDGSLWGSKFFICRSYYRANQQLQRSSSNHSKSFMFLKLLMHNVTLHWLNICFLLDNRLDSLGEPRTQADGGSRLQGMSQGPVDLHPLHATVLSSAYPVSKLGFPGCSLHFCNGWHPVGLHRCRPE